MDVLPRVTRQLIELFRAMAPVQRVSMLVLSVVVLLGFGWVIFRNQGSDYKVVSFGKVFSADEIASAEQALVSAGLGDYRRDGQRLLVPARELDRYNAALLESDALPADLGSQMLKQFETLGPFSTDRQRQQMKEALLLQELRRMIKAVPDIQDARVIIASSERRAGWNQKSRTSANVMVKPRARREISPLLVISLRHVVANMVPDLKPADVTIFDVSRGQAYSGDPNQDPFDNQCLQQARALTDQYEQQIHKALTHIPNVIVTVHVDLDALRSATIRSKTARSRNGARRVADLPAGIDDTDPSQAGFHGSDTGNTETTRDETENEIAAAMPNAVQVSVSIPRDYIREIAARPISKDDKSAARNPELIEEDVIAKVEQIVGRLIPAGSPTNAISVTCVDRLKGESTTPRLSSGTNEWIMVLRHQWFVPAVVVVFTLVALLTIRAMARAASVPEPSSDRVSEVPDADRSVGLEPEAQQTFVTAHDRNTLALKDEIQSLVKSDIPASAILISRWLFDGERDPVEGNRKTVIVLLSLDQSLAADVLGKMSREHVERITLAIAGVDNVTREEQEAVLEEFKSAFASRPMMQPAGPWTARELLERTLDRNDVEPIKQQIEEQIESGPFAFLRTRHADDIRRLLHDEHPQTIAVVCAQLPSGLAAQVLAGFDAEVQADILSRVARLGPTDPDLIVEIASLLQERMGRHVVRRGGMTRAADLLHEASRSASHSVLQAIERRDVHLAGTLRESLFSFKDIESLDPTTLQTVLEKTDHCQWAVALKGSPESLRQRVFSSLSKNVSRALKNEVNSLTPLRLSEITVVQKQIADTILKLDQENQIELPRSKQRFLR